MKLIWLKQIEVIITLAVLRIISFQALSIIMNSLASFGSCLCISGAENMTSKYIQLC